MNSSPASYRSIFTPGLFGGQVIVVTGGGSGIGRCTAHELASLGAQVVLVGRKPEKLEAVKAEIESAGGKAATQAFDIRQEDAVRDAVRAIVAAHGRIDGLVNNAGGQYITPLADISAKGWEAVIHTNLTGGFLVARECFVQSMRSHGGAIVNIVADIWGSMPNMGHSGAARAGMVSFTETAALEWAANGVRVNAVAPGLMVTDMTAGQRETEHGTDWYMSRVPIKRHGEADEIAGPVVFLASSMASYVNGVVLPVDGGYLAV